MFYCVFKLNKAFCFSRYVASSIVVEVWKEKIGCRNSRNTNSFFTSCKDCTNVFASNKILIVFTYLLRIENILAVVGGFQFLCNFQCHKQ